MFRKLQYLLFLVVCFVVFTFNEDAEAQQKKLDSFIRVTSAPGVCADTMLINEINKFSADYGSQMVGHESLRRLTQTSLQFAEKLRYKKGIANAYLNLGSFKVMSNRDSRALVYLEKALRIFTETKDHKGRYDVYNILGWYYGGVQDYRTELNFYSLALAEVKVLKDPYLTAVIIGNIGGCYEDQKNFTSAIACYRHMLSDSKALKKPAMEMWAYSDLSSIWVKTGRFKDALRYSQAALKIYKGHKMTDFQSLDDINNQIGISLIRLGKLDKGEKYLNNAIKIAKNVQDLDQLVVCLRNRFTLDSTRGNTGLAFIDLGEYTRLNDSISSNKYNRRVSYYQAKFELWERKSENLLLRQKDQRNDSLIMDLRWALVGVVTCFLIIAMFFFTLRTSNRKSTKLVRLNNHLFSIISHDLRIPFTQVKGLLSLFESKIMTEQEFLAVIPVLREQTDNTLSLLDNILVWSKNQMNGFIPNKEDFKIAGLVTENIHLQSFRVATKKIDLTHFVNSDMKVSADREMINVVLRNLLSNAIKFTPANGNISISAIESTNRNIVISITDTGTGIGDSDKDKLFKFSNFTRVGTENEKGTGMGLKLCHDLLELNHGKIWMESTMGQGSIFSFSIPAA